MGARIDKAVVVRDEEAGIELTISPITSSDEVSCVRIEISLACAPECKGVLELDAEISKTLASAILAARKASLVPEAA